MIPLDIMNLPANKKTEQGWSVFIQCKAIADGEADNVWTSERTSSPIARIIKKQKIPATKYSHRTANNRRFYYQSELDQYLGLDHNEPIDMNIFSCGR